MQKLRQDDANTLSKVRHTCSCRFKILQFVWYENDAILCEVWI
jgi:hypothetical protein